LVWDIEKHRAIHLRLNRIEHAKALRFPAVIPDERPLEHAARYQIGGWFAPDPPFAVEVRVTGTNWPKALLEAPPALPDIAVYAEGRDVRVRFMATEPYAPSRWILQFGPDAQVLAPDALRDVVKERLSEALAKY
jgi:predicted DNA-binding transcriptional regulator YafY